MTKTPLFPRTAFAPPHRRHWMLALLLVAAATLPFLPAISGGWVYDDALLIVQDSRLQTWAGLQEVWSSHLFSARRLVLQAVGQRPFYRPVVVSSYAWDWWWGNGRPTAFHATNVLCHAAAALLGFGALRRWGASRPVAFCASLCFALHPTRAESVAWISGRTDVLATVFLLGASGLYAKARQHSRSHGERWAWWSATYVAAVLALLCKETAIVFPVFALLEEWRRSKAANLSHFFRHYRDWERPWLASVALIALYLVARSAFLPLVPSGTNLSLFTTQHAQLIAESAARHLEFLLVPTDLTLFSARIGMDEDGRLALSTARVVLGAVVLVGYLLALIGAWRTPRLWWFLVLTAASLLPTANLAPTGLIFSAQARYTYLALLPLAASAFTLVELRIPRFWIASPLLLVLAPLTWMRSTDFRSNEAFWRAEFIANPGVPETISERMTNDLPSVGRETYLRRAACGFGRVKRYWGATGSTSFVGSAVGVLATDPELSREGQRNVLRFLDDLSAGRPAHLEGRLNLAIDPGSATSRALRKRTPKLDLMAAHLSLKMGRVPDALQSARRAMAACSQCDDVRTQAAVIPLLAGNRELMHRWATPLPASERQRLEDAAQLLEGRSDRPMAVRAWFEAEAGRVLRQPALSYQAMQPHLSEVAKEAPFEVRMAVALMARSMGDLGPAQALFATLPQAERLRMVEEGLWSAPVSDRNAPFVPGTCALPSELEP